MTALQTRHLAELRTSEVTRALRAVSSAYVQRRHRLQSGAPLDGAGKRAAFALFYGPLHFLTVWHVLAALETRRCPATLVDLGCGTGAAGAAWAVRCQGRPEVVGIDRHPWAAAEARWTYGHFGLRGRARVGGLRRAPVVSASSAAVAGYVLNELPDVEREDLVRSLTEGARRGAGLLILEPLARGAAPWWADVARTIESAGGRADEWRFPVELPAFVRLLDRAAGLDHRELKVRTLACNLDA